MNKRNKKRSILIVVALLIIILLSAVSCTNKQEYVLQYLDDQELVTEIYDSADNINTQTRYLDSIGVVYWASH